MIRQVQVLHLSYHASGFKRSFCVDSRAAIALTEFFGSARLAGGCIQGSKQSLLKRADLAHFVATAMCNLAHCLACSNCFGCQRLLPST